MTTKENKTIGILVGGGPAPGINGVISAATIEARNRGCRVIGILYGLSWLASGDSAQTVDLEIDDVSRIHLTGGSILHISRAGRVQDPEVRRKIHETLDELGIDALITIGGEGTAGAVAKLCATDPSPRCYVHVPKTIDNDIPLPGGFSTFGYQTARHVGVEVVQSLMEDAKSIGRWYLIITMGRRSGQLALGIGKAAGATLTLIPEEFDKKRITIDELMLPIEGSILRRRADGRNDGVVVLAEGLAEKIDPDELKRMHPVDRDPHGKIRLTDLPLGYTLRRRLNERFERRGFKANIMEKLIGYELRGAPPIPFDAEYTRDLGFAATRALLSRNRSGIVCRNAGVIGVVPFKDFMDPTTGEMRVRCVDTSTESFLVSKRYQIRMRKQDLEDPAMRKKLAIAGCMTEEELLEHFAPILNED